MGHLQQPGGGRHILHSVTQHPVDGATQKHHKFQAQPLTEAEALFAARVARVSPCVSCVTRASTSRRCWPRWATQQMRATPSEASPLACARAMATEAAVGAAETCRGTIR